MSPETAKFLIKIFKWIALATGFTIFFIVPPVSWVIMAIAGVSYPYMVFVIAYGVYTVILFITFCNYLHTVSQGKDARGSFYNFIVKGW